MSSDRPPDRDKPKYSTPMTVSTNRYDDLHPYTAFVYREDPATWGSIFPWEFPQYGTREQEEEFILRYFDEHEVHMQGGAHGDGEGFRFLKQAWYCIALWNLEHRITMFADWWLAKESSVELINDKNMQPFLLRDDVTASTFFADEIPEYGEKFLTNVIPYLQWKLREMLNPEESAKKPVLAVDTAMASKHSTTAPNAEAKASTTGSADPSAATHTQSAPVTRTKTAYIPEPERHSAPATEAVPYGHTPLEQTASVSAPQAALDSLSQKRERGYKQTSSNHSGKTFQNRQPMPLDNHNVQTLPQHPRFDPAQMQQHPTAQSHIPSGGPTEFFPALSQGEPFPNMPQQTPFMSTQLPPNMYHMGQQDATHVHPNLHQNMHRNMPYGEIPEHFFNAPIIDRTNEQHAVRSFSAEHQRPFYGNNYLPRGSQRRNSQGARGGRYRGFQSNRGRGRGRGNTSGDYGRSNLHNENMHPPSWNDSHSYATHHPKGRRESVVHERNWRSGSDDPQMQQLPAGWGMQESLHHQPYPTPGYQIPPPTHQHMPVYATRPPHESEIERVNVPTQQYLGDPAAQASKRLFIPRTKRHEPNFLRKDQSCGQTWIGQNCAFVDRLVVFNVPIEVEEQYLYSFFGQFGEVKEIWRPGPGHPKFKYCFVNGGMMFVTFARAASARQCLDTKPTVWLDGRAFTVEVPKIFWDSKHPHYNSTQDDYTTPRHREGSDYPMIVPSILKRPESIVPPPSVLSGTSTPLSSSEMQASSDTTPTPSGANTPKKNKKKKPKRKGQNRDQDDLRKVSLSAAAEQVIEQLARKNNADDQMDTSPTSSKYSGKGKKAVEEESTDVQRLVSTDAIESAMEQSLSEPTKTPHTSHPEIATITATETEATTLPWTDQTVSEQIEATIAPPSGSAQLDIQTASEPAFSPADVVVTRLPLPDTTASVPHSTTEKLEDKPVAEAVTNEEAAFSDQEEKASTVTQAEGVQGDAVVQIPNSSSNAVSQNEPEKNSLVIDMKQTIEQNEEHKPIVVFPASPEPVSTPDIDKDAHTDSHTPDTKIDTDVPVSDKRPATLQVPIQGMPEENASLPTPAQMYFTAPNTPAVGPDSPVAETILAKPTEPTIVEEPPQAEDSKDEPDVTAVIEETWSAAEDDATTVGKETPSVAGSDATTSVEDKPDQSADSKNTQSVQFTEQSHPKKAEKPKGPATTESFSLFGKKKEQKPKAGKKGSLKGKPKSMDRAMSMSSDGGSASASRAASVVVTPTPEVTDQKPQHEEGKVGGEGMARADSKIGVKPSKKGKKTKNVQRAEVSPAETSTVSPAATHEESTPSKRKGFGGLLAGLFGGGQHTDSKPSSRPSSRPPSPEKKSLLADSSKAQGLPLKIDTNLHNEISGGPVPVSGNEAPVGKGEELAAPSSVLENQSMAQSSASIVNTTNDTAAKDTATTDIGLGISKAETDTSIDTAPVPKKKTNKKKRGAKKQRSSEVDASTEPQQELSTPVSEYRKESNSSLFVPEANSEIADDGSEMSSETLGADTPTSDVHSPTMSNTSKKLPSRTAAGSSNLVEARSPRWKQKRRARTPRASDTQSLSDVIDPDGTYTIIPLHSDAMDLDDNLYVYAGAGKMSGDEFNNDNNGSAEQTDRIRKLARKILKHGHGEDASEATSKASEEEDDNEQATK